MEIKVKASNYNLGIIHEIGFMLDKAQLQINEVYFDKIKQTVTLPLTRYEYLGRKKHFLLADTPIFDKSKGIKSKFIIYNVTSCNIEKQKDYPVNEITLLFGIHFKKNEIYFSSAEESLGDTMYSMSVIVSSINFELKDIEEEKAGANTGA